MIKEYTKENLKIRIFATRDEMGNHGAEMAAQRIRTLLKNKDVINILFAAAPSQNELLANLCMKPDIEWNRINAFHMDEYIGLPIDNPQTFGKYLNNHIFSKVPFRKIYYINGLSDDPKETCNIYTELLNNNPLDFGFLGIGENGHIAFNDPPVADFEDPLDIKVVELDAICRQQQVNDACFIKLADVPTHAITLTIPALFRIPAIFCTAPTVKKAQAIYNTINGEISTKCPASILRLHRDTTIYLDEASASLL